MTKEEEAELLAREAEQGEPASVLKAQEAAAAGILEETAATSPETFAVAGRQTAVARLAAVVGTASVVVLGIAAAVGLGAAGKIFVVFAASAEIAYRSHIQRHLPAILHAAEAGW